MDGLTTQQQEAVVAVAGLSIAVIGLLALAFYVLLIIALWRIFTKAGEAGWKALIPIYNVYILYKISNLSFLYWFIIPVLAAGILLGIGGSMTNDTAKALISLVGYAIELVMYAKFSSALAKAFGKGTGFAVGLFFFPNIFQLILGFGSAKYVGNKN